MKIAEDGKTAAVTGDYEGLYVRVAFTLYNTANSESGLFFAQGYINDGVITIPVFDVPGLDVTGVCVALVNNTEDITSKTPSVVDFDFEVYTPAA